MQEGEKAKAASGKGSAKDTRQLDTIPEPEPAALAEKQINTITNDNQGEGSTALGTIQPHADPDLNATLTGQHTTLEHTDLNLMSDTKRSPRVVQPSPRLPAHETIQEDERESDYASVAPQGKLKGLHVGMASTGNHQPQAAASGKTGSRVTLSNQSQADDTTQKDGTSQKDGTASHQQQQSRMKVNINSPSRDEAIQPSFGATPQMQAQMIHETQMRAQAEAKRQLEQSRQLNNRKVTGASNIRTLIKSAATRD